MPFCFLSTLIRFLKTRSRVKVFKNGCVARIGVDGENGGFEKLRDHAHLTLAWESQNKQSSMADSFVFMMFSLISTFIASLEVNISLLICVVEIKNGRAWPGDKNGCFLSIFVV